jgi:hypothetical protein
MVLRRGSEERGEFLDTKNNRSTNFAEAPLRGWRTKPMTWSVRNGKLYCGRDLVAVRRVVVQMVAGGISGTIPEEKARHMIRMERALSLRGLSESLREERP